MDYVVFESNGDAPAEPINAGNFPTPPENRAVAELLERIAQLHAEQDASPFRTRAYHNAAVELKQLGTPLHEILEREGIDGLDALPGVGPSIAGVIHEYLTTGQARLLTRLEGHCAPEELFTTSPGALGDTLLAPHVGTLLAIDAAYREQAAQGKLHRLAPRRFNPLHEAWLPIWHTERSGWHFTALFSNSAVAHRMAATHDWVVVFYDREGHEGQCTVVTERQGEFAGRRVVRGREAECHGYHAHAAQPPEQVAAATARALRSPRAYPGSEAHIECIETHLSWVFLTRALAYKLKKPNRTPYFDYTSLDARRRACERELQLNRRLAASVYLAVVPVTSRAAELEVEGSGHVVEWLVKMRRLPCDRMLDACIARNAVTPAEIDTLARVLSRFYARAPKAGFDGAQYAEHLAADLEAKRASLALPRYDLEPGAVRAAFEALAGWLAVHSAYVEARGPLVCEAHGDLRPEHVCLEPEPVIIDCLDFDRGLRLLDPWSELAFLELECRRLGNAWMGPRLASRYLQETKDGAPEPLRGFYQGYHAFVRAAVAAWHLDEPGQNLDKWRGRAAEYLRLATQAV